MSSNKSNVDWARNGGARNGGARNAGARNAGDSRDSRDAVRRLQQLREDVACVAGAHAELLRQVGHLQSQLSEQSRRYASLPVESQRIIDELEEDLLDLEARLSCNAYSSSLSSLSPASSPSSSLSSSLSSSSSSPSSLSLSTDAADASTASTHHRRGRRMTSTLFGEQSVRVPLVFPTDRNDFSIDELAALLAPQ